MPNLIEYGTRIQDVNHRRCRFKQVRIGQLFYAERRWYQKVTARTVVRADDKESARTFFRGGVMVRVLDETRPRRVNAGLTYDEFINQSL